MIVCVDNRSRFVSFRQWWERSRRSLKDPEVVQLSRSKVKDVRVRLPESFGLVVTLKDGFGNIDLQIRLPEVEICAKKTVGFDVILESW